DNWPKQEELIPEPILLVNEPIVEKAKPEIKLDVEPTKKTEELDLIVEEPKSDTELLADKLVEESGEYDPTLDLSGYRFPPLELLNEYETGKVQVTQEELNANKDKIVATLTNFKIGISS